MARRAREGDHNIGDNVIDIPSSVSRSELKIRRTFGMAGGAPIEFSKSNEDPAD
jgi:hypothetical protein